jgi:hypothetical protein
MTTTTTEGVRCSAWARDAGLDPIGSAGCYSGYLLVEVPLPWPRDVGEIPEVAGLGGLLSGRGIRVQALVPKDSRRRVIIHSLPQDDPGGGDGFHRFTRREAEVAGDLESTVADLLGPGAGANAGTDTGTGAARDLLVCTHGRRDICCGSLGTKLAASLAHGDLPAGVRLWRTSHTGGHRFAPTFVVLPEATCWAYADEELVDRILRRRGDAAEVADRYRGCAGLASPQLQALERDVLRRVGWPLLDSNRSGSVSADGSARLVVRTPDGNEEIWEGTVRAGREMPVPDCGRPIGEARKSETEWLVAGVGRL